MGVRVLKVPLPSPCCFLPSPVFLPPIPATTGIRMIWFRNNRTKKRSSNPRRDVCPSGAGSITQNFKKKMETASICTSRFPFCCRCTDHWYLHSMQGSILDFGIYTLYSTVLYDTDYSSLKSSLSWSVLRKRQLKVRPVLLHWMALHSPAMHSSCCAMHC
jgi:hypothetical protein